MEQKNKQTKEQVIEELITLLPYLGNKKTGLRNQSKKKLEEFQSQLKGDKK